MSARKKEEVITKEQMDREEAAGIDEGWLDADPVDIAPPPIPEAGEEEPLEEEVDVNHAFDLNETRRVLKLLLEAVYYASSGKKIGPRTAQIMKSRIRSGTILLKHLGEPEKPKTD